MTAGVRLDIALVERSLVSSRNRAQRLVSQGRVHVNGTPAVRASQPIHPADEVLVVEPERWVSRAAHKLDAALDAIDPGGKLFADHPVVLDAGASTGGFTQVCLERGASLVHAIDVGHDQIHPSLRADHRVHVVEGFNLRHLTPADLPGPVDLVVCDVSFISLTMLLEQLLSVLTPTGMAVLMVKPQFEVGRELLGPGGVVTDPVLQQETVDRVAAQVSDLGWQVVAGEPAAITGTHGNQEFFLALSRPQPHR